MRVEKGGPIAHLVSYAISHTVIGAAMGSAVAARIMNPFSIGRLPSNCA
jgi:hypothetical protein